MISTFVFDAALRTVSAALLLSSCLSFFRDLWSRRSLASLRKHFLWVKVYQSIMVVAGWKTNRTHEAQALFRERARLSIQYFAL